ncbi:hypothetical protein AMS68_003202 [Peltaster fructicola]|uniref:Uncharacterized protein n=1 Tax=Peltaster fructicola TaxID=286661 RepID=A0A6H0XSR3_9PEZI|nr:hypothetical protein AMS68_003202 [Peltaster fructicola]
MLLDRRVNLRFVALVLLACAAIYAFQTRRPFRDNSPDKDDYSSILPGKDSTGFRQPWSTPIQHPVVDYVDHLANYVPKDDKYRIVYSQSTIDRKYFTVDFAGVNTYNVNIIPHPAKKNKWIVVAQHGEYRDDINASEQIACVAEFSNGVLHCSRAPAALPITPSILGKCDGKWAYANMRRGPRDARVFYGPEQPYIMYGSQSLKACLGLWVQNLWMLLDGAKHPEEGFARAVMEIQRPEPFDQIQKNYFLFWDNSSEIHVHYDIYPQRAYSPLQYDGSVVSTIWGSKGLNVAEFAADKDQICIDRLYPKVDVKKDEGLHQGTNSLAITMCKRSDPICVETDDNTFILHIMQHKQFYDWHGIYEPYPVLFRRRTPFELYAVAQKPLWYHGRDELNNKTNWRNFQERSVPEGHTQMFYTTSISWKNVKQTYHGYVDDVLFIGFGVEDTQAGAIDVLASDILQDLGFC